MELVTANVVLQIGTDRLQANYTVPAGPISATDLLPIARVLLQTILQIAEAELASRGSRVSCTKGCGACCRQLVPISEADARALLEAFQSLPESRQAELRQRFRDGVDRLRDSGLWTKLLNRDDWSPSDIETIGLEYFHLGVACPFLEDESCSIHADRPLTCREYLVTSPAGNCANPNRDNIDQVPLPLKVWPAMTRLDPPKAGSRFARWVPLIGLFEWQAENREPAVERPGPEVLREFFQHLTGKSPPDAPVVPFAPGA